MQADWYFDYISPYAYFQFLDLHRLPPDVSLRIRPVLFAGLLNHWGQKGPAEIPAKRLQTYRHCHWVAARRGIAFRMPGAHPFVPLPWLRLTLAADDPIAAASAIFHFIWAEGGDAADGEAALALGRRLGMADPAARIAAPEVKLALRHNTEEAIARGVYGVPTLGVGDELFWGSDVLDMALDYIGNPGLFAEGEYARISDLPAAARR